MKTATATAIFATDLAQAENTAPEWVELFPAGPELKARDGRTWTADPQAVLSAFAANNAPLPIDYEHGQDHLAPEGKEAPAAGWIVKVENRAGAVWGMVEWTARAAKMIVDREYRFLSPAFNTTKAGRITRLLGAGLVNRPALEMTALSREQPQEETDMKAIAKALGLADDADEAAILAALGKLQSDHETALAAAENRADTTEVATLRTELAALRQKDTDRDIDAALDLGTQQGKITPASRDNYRAMCAVEGGLARFKALAATLPVLGDPTKLDGKTVDTEAGDERAPAEIASLARKYQQEQAALGNMVTMTAAVAHVKEQK